MWRALPTIGKPIREVRIEGSGRDRDLVLIPVQGQRLRLLASGDIHVETGGRVLVRTTPLDLKSLRVTFTGPDLVLAQSDVDFQGDDNAWQRFWRQAQARSRPWWNETDGDELDLDLPMPARLKIVGP